MGRELAGGGAPPAAPPGKGGGEGGPGGTRGRAPAGRGPVEGTTLRLVRARVRGSGAGMEPGDGAVLRGGWWEWAPGTQVAELHLAASGATGAGWRLCSGATCHDLGTQAQDALRIAPCPP